MSRSTWRRVITALSVAALTCLVPAATSAARSQQPGAELVAVLHHTDVTRFTGDTDLFVTPGIYLATVNGALEFDASRGADGRVRVWQVRRDNGRAHRIREMHVPGAVDLTQGLPGFFDVALRNAQGRLIRVASTPFCPGGSGSSRVDASGPDRPTYPQVCGGVFSQGAVWGVDRGWAVPLTLDLPFGSIPDGRYTLVVSIDPAYARQLQVQRRSVSAMVEMTVTTSTGGPCPMPKCPPMMATRGTHHVHRSEGSAATARPADHADDPLAGTGGLPDLRALPAHDLSTEHNTDDGHDYLDFGATIWNAGSGPLVLEGFRNGDAAVMPATQFVYRGGKPSASYPAGQFEFDTRPGHDHWHMEDIARYDLLDAAGARVVLSDKQSFCLAPTDPVDLTLPGADWQPDQTGLWSACSGQDAIWLREVLPAGWGDTYYQSVAGQSFDITGLPNGRYQVRITTDPSHRLRETSYANNTAVIAVDLGGDPGARTVTVAG